MHQTTQLDWRFGLTNDDLDQWVEPHCFCQHLLDVRETLDIIDGGQTISGNAVEFRVKGLFDVWVFRGELPGKAKRGHSGFVPRCLGRSVNARFRRYRSLRPDSP